MNPAYFGDSYDLVKRFFCTELSALGYSVAVDPMFTGAWNGTENDFYRLIGADRTTRQRPENGRSALFLDPDTGVHKKTSPKHVSTHRLTEEAARHSLVFSFDQSFSRQAKPANAMREKLETVSALGCSGMYYDSHARFLFVSMQERVLDELHAHLVSLGMPSLRLLRHET